MVKINPETYVLPETYLKIAINGLGGLDITYNLANQADLASFGDILYLLNSGKMEPLLKEKIAEYAKTNEKALWVAQVIDQWLEREDSVMPYIHPLQVLGQSQGQ